MTDASLDRVVTAVVGDSTIQATSDAPVPWWSFGKTVLASAALVLVAQGRLQLDAPVGGRSYTLHQLLGHRAGLRCYGTVRAYHKAVAASGPPWSVADLLRRVDADTLDYKPGQGWGYSNVGYLLVRRMVEEASGLPLDAALSGSSSGPWTCAGSCSRGFRPTWTRRRGATRGATIRAGSTTACWSEQLRQRRCSCTVCSRATCCRPTCCSLCRTPNRSAALFPGAPGRRRPTGWASWSAEATHLDSCGPHRRRAR